MNKTNGLLLSLSLALLLSGCATPPQARHPDNQSGNFRDDIEFARSQVYPALVNISVLTKSPMEGRMKRYPAVGSGTIVTKDGHVLTNFHVAGNTTRIICTLVTGEQIPAEVIAHDPLTDLSVLKILKERRKDPKIPLPFARLGNSDEVRVGDPVLAMGNPLALSSTVTQGIVSNTERVFKSFIGTDLMEMNLSGERTGMLTRWIQHDALILPGNSGGPLVNIQGEIIGINELGGGGTGFAIPSQLASEVLNMALESGEIKRGWLGITLLPVLKLGRSEGILVSSVIEGGPADQGGLKPGDIILKMDDKKVAARFLEEIPLVYSKISQLKIDKKISFEIEREGKIEELVIKISPMPDFLGDEEVFIDWGIIARDITPPMALFHRYDSEEGIVITSIRPGYPADSAVPNLRVGDVILEVNGKAVTDMTAFQQLLKESGNEPTTLVRFHRETADLVTVLQPKEDEKHRTGGELPNAWLGLETQVLMPAVAKALGLEDKKGFRVSEVFEGTKAELAGFQKGDILVAMEDEEFTAHRKQDQKDLSRLIRDYGIGEVVTFKVIRGQEKLSVQVELEETPRTAVKVEAFTEEDIEFTVRELTFRDRQEHRWNSETKGLVVAKVTMGGWAYLGGLRVSDLIQSVQGQKITTIEDLKNIFKEIKTEQSPLIRIFVTRGFKTHFVFIEPDWTDNDNLSNKQ